MENFLTKYKRRIPLIKKCLNAVESGEFYADCWFICKSFHWNKISTLFEGEVNLYERAFLIIVSFKRRMTLHQGNLN